MDALRKEELDRWYEYDEPQYYHPEGDNEYNPYRNQTTFHIDDLVDELPQYDINDLKGDYNPIDYFKYYRYLINALLVGLPWFMTAISCLVYNIYFNYEWNRYWASGNFYLVLSTIFLIYQVVNSILVVFELPIYLRAFRFTRLVSFFTAIGYNFLYLLSLFEWWGIIYEYSDKTSFEVPLIFIYMMLGYNAVLHITIIPVNLMIILKELSL